MKFDILRKTDIFKNGEVESVQVHYQLRGADDKSMHNGFVTIEPTNDMDEITAKTIEVLITDVNQLKAE